MPSQTVLTASTIIRRDSANNTTSNIQYDCVDYLDTRDKLDTSYIVTDHDQALSRFMMFKCNHAPGHRCASDCMIGILSKADINKEA